MIDSQLNFDGKVTSLYLHGLGATELRPRERRLLERNRRKGISYEDLDIDWRRDTLSKLLERAIERSLGILATMTEDDVLILEGSSAGGSLALNSYVRISDPRLRVILHSARLRRGRLLHGDPRTLEHCAHLGTESASQAFYQSVLLCENETIPNLIPGDQANIAATIPWADEIVPIQTMRVPGILVRRVPMIQHGIGIGLGILAVPELLQRMVNHP